MICSYVNNERMEVALKEIGNNVETNIDDMTSYMENTIEVSLWKAFVDIHVYLTVETPIQCHF